MTTAYFPVASRAAIPPGVDYVVQYVGDTISDRASIAAPKKGDRFYDKQTDTWWTYTGSVWRAAVFSGPSAAGVLIATSDQSKENNTYVSDDTLTVPVEASKKYLIRFFLFYDGTATGDLKLQFTGPAGGTVRKIIHGGTFNAAGSLYAKETAFAQNHGWVSTGANNAWVEADIVLANGVNAGSVTHQFAQNTTTAGQPTTRRAGSRVEYREFT